MMDIFKTKFVQDIIEGVIAFFFKWWVVGSYIMMAILTKFSFDRSRGIRLTFWEGLWQVVFAWVMGSWAAIILVNKKLDAQIYWVVPLATLLADKIYLYIISNWKLILFNFLKIIKALPEKKEEEEGDNDKNHTV